MKLWLFCAALIAATCHAAEPAKPHIVTGIEASDAAHNDSGIIRVVVTNDGRADAFVLLNGLPETLGDGVLLNGLFEVKADDGDEALYRGNFGETRPAPGSWVRIGAGETRAYDVDITRNYGMHPGLYRIVFKMTGYFARPFTYTKDESTVPEVSFVEPSAAVNVWFTSNAVARGDARHDAERH